MKPAMTALVALYELLTPDELAIEESRQTLQVHEHQRRLAAAQQALAAIAKARKIINRKQRGTVYGR